MAIIIPAPTTGECIRGMVTLIPGPFVRSQDTIMVTILAIAIDINRDISAASTTDTITGLSPLIVTDLTDLIDLTGLDSSVGLPCRRL